MAQIRMTPETMRARAREAKAQAEAMQNIRTKMQNLINTLKAEWEGQSMQGYEERFNKIKPVFTNAWELLGEMSDNLTSAAKIVEETDRNIANQLKK